VDLDVESTVRDQLYGPRAEVYRARDERLQRDVAVKIIAGGLAHDSAAVRRFRHEAELCARLAHRNVAAVLDAGSRPREYIVMELVDGGDVATLPAARGVRRHDTAAGGVRSTVVGHRAASVQLDL
jgi:serine/threonine protein kinase